MNSEQPESSAVWRGCFVTTHWSIVLSAGRSDSTQAQAALEQLCATYWFPLYAYVRRRGYSVEDAQDLTQEFFARLIQRHWLASADAAKGRFRTFLLTAMERFLANEWDKARALKRGSGRPPLPLQLDSAETRYGVEPADDARTPQQVFEYHWACTLLAEVVRQLAEEFRARGEGELFAHLEPCLVGPRESLPYAELAAKLRMRIGALKVAVHRLRHAYRQRLRAEIARTLASPGEVEVEMHHLFNVLTTGGGGALDNAQTSTRAGPLRPKDQL